MMNKLVLPLLLLFSLCAIGQERPRMEKIRALKVAFITEELNLSAEEAQAFWPVYNAHEEKMHAFRDRERREIGEELRNPERLSNDQANALVDALIALEKEKHGAQEAFIKKMRSILSPKKTLLLMKSEEDFKRRLIEQFRGRRGGPR